MFEDDGFMGFLRKRGCCFDRWITRWGSISNSQPLDLILRDIHNTCASLIVLSLPFLSLSAGSAASLPWLCPLAPTGYFLFFLNLSLNSILFILIYSFMCSHLTSGPHVTFLQFQAFSETGWLWHEINEM